MADNGTYVSLGHVDIQAHTEWKHPIKIVCICIDKCIRISCAHTHTVLVRATLGKYSLYTNSQTQGPLATASNIRWSEELRTLPRIRGLYICNTGTMGPCNMVHRPVNSPVDFNSVAVNDTGCTLWCRDSFISCSGCYTHTRGRFTRQHSSTSCGTTFRSP